MIELDISQDPVVERCFDQVRRSIAELCREAAPIVTIIEGREYQCIKGLVPLMTACNAEVIGKSKLVEKLGRRR